jgi:DNA-binding NtrC family response regulator
MESAEMSMNNRTVLVIDDEAEQRDLIRHMLRLDDYRVLEASDYDEALGVQANHLGEADVVLIDVRLPGGNGYELAKELLAIEPHLKVLFTSGHAGAELCRFFNMPVSDVHFLQKPLQLAELLGRLKLVLASAGTSTRNASAY